MAWFLSRCRSLSLVDAYARRHCGPGGPREAVHHIVLAGQLLFYPGSKRVEAFENAPGLDCAAWAGAITDSILFAENRLEVGELLVWHTVTKNSPQ